MFFAIGAASSAIDLLSSLTSSTSTSKTGFVPASSFPPADPTASAMTGGSAGTQLSPATMNTLLAAQSQSQSAATSRTAALKDLFAQIDANGDGQITKSEFGTALGAGGTNLQMADDVFSKMDLNGDGLISMDEMSQSLQKSGHGHHHHHAGGASDTGNADALMQALQGATSTSSTNSDGSTTTTLTYADGTKITMTKPAASSSTPATNNSAVQSYNLVERMIERQAQAIAANATQSLSMSV